MILILQGIIEEYAATMTSLTKAKADLGEGMKSGLRIIGSLEKKNDLTAADQKWDELVDTIANKNKELCVKNSALQKQKK